MHEPVGAAQRGIDHARRLVRMLLTARRLFRADAISQARADAIVQATSGVNDPDLATAVEDRVLSRDGAPSKGAKELKRLVRQALMRLDPAGEQDRARAAAPSLCLCR